MILDKKRKAQLKRERNAVDEAAEEFRKDLKLKKRREYSRPSVALLREYWEPLARVIKAEQEHLKTAKERRETYEIPIVVLDPDCLAVITLKSIIWARGFDRADDGDDEAGEEETENERAAKAAQANKKEAKLTRLTREIGRRSRWHWGNMSTKAKEMALNRCTEKYPVEIKEREKDRAAKFLGSDWSIKNRDIPFGAGLLSLAGDAGIIIKKRGEAPGKPHKPYVVEFTAGFLQSFKRWKKKYGKLLTPFYRPMIYEPVKWVGPEGGGYLTNVDNKRIHLVKHRNDARLIETFASGDLEQTIAAVNALQETKWRINSSIYNVMFQANAMAKAARKAVKEAKRATKMANKAVNEANEPVRAAEPVETKEADLCATFPEELEDVLIISADIKDEEVIFFPYQLDFRGRIYPLPTIVNPIEDDPGRSLLEFAEGKSLGDKGAYWLAIHLANCHGNDKVSFEDRVAWVHSNEKMILRCAEDPLQNLEWIKPEGSKTIDAPWRFLAACFEWKEYRAKGAEFLSHLPIIMDGTCNGLQHLSAMRRDADGARETNLLPGDKPRDIYQKVAKKLKDLLEADQLEDVWQAKEWRKVEITRKVCKRAVMTTPYGVTKAGISEQLHEEDFTKPLLNRWKCCSYMAEKMILCIGEIVDQGNEMKNWFQDIAHRFADANRGVSWVAPSGFPVLQETWVQKPKRVKAGKYSLLNNKPLKPPKIDSKKQKQKIVANFIHSFDAAHLVITINHLHSEGQRDFCVIHDGFGVHCCNVDTLHVALREEFIRIYEKPVIKDFHLAQLFEAARALYSPDTAPINLPTPPTVGKFDIQRVRKSKYFFC